MTAAIPDWDLADRMRKALRQSDVGAGEMAEYVGVSRTTVSAWLGGKYYPRAGTLRLWAMRCGVPFTWLRDGVFDPGAEQAESLARLTERFPELRADYSGYADAEGREVPAPVEDDQRVVVQLPHLDSNQKPFDYRDYPVAA